MSKLEFKSKCSEPSYLYVQMYIKYLEGNVEDSNKKIPRKSSTTLHLQRRQTTLYIFVRLCGSIITLEQ